MAVHQTSLSFTISQSLLKLISIELVKKNDCCLYFVVTLCTLIYLGLETQSDHDLGGKNFLGCRQKAETPLAPHPREPPAVCPLGTAWSRGVSRPSLWDGTREGTGVEGLAGGKRKEKEGKATNNVSTSHVWQRCVSARTYYLLKLLEWGGRREEGSGWATHVYLWRIHFDIWQN